jgi:hypothetical protein
LLTRREGAAQCNGPLALGELERARLRQQAHGWLRADLEHWAKTLEAGKEDGHNQVLGKLRHRPQDADLASVRDAQALATLPEAERRSWEQLWADVAALLDHAQKGKRRRLGRRRCGGLFLWCSLHDRLQSGTRQRIGSAPFHLDPRTAVQLNGIEEQSKAWLATRRKAMPDREAIRHA